MAMLKLPPAAEQTTWPWTSLGWPSMVSLAVPEPADADTEPAETEAVAVTDGVSAALDAVVSAFLLEQPDRPATTIAAPHTATVTPRITGFLLRLLQLEISRVK